MRYRGRECTARQFSDETGTGTEYLLDGQVVVREHATRILSPAEAAAQSAADAAMAANARAAAEKQAVFELSKAALDPAILAAKVEEVLARTGAGGKP